MRKRVSRRRAHAGFRSVGWLCLVMLLNAFSASGSAPANDHFTNATVIAGAVGRITGTVLEATHELGEPGFQGSVWYRWMAPTNGEYFFNLAYFRDYDGQANVYTGAT